MATSNVNPNGFPKDANFRKQISILDENFEDVTLVAAIPALPESATSSVEGALEYLGNDKEKLLKIIANGLKNEMGKKIANDPATVWYNKDTETVYTGAKLDSANAGKTILNLAKFTQAALYAKDAAAAKAKVVEFLKSPAGADLRKGLIVTETTETNEE